LHGQAGQRFISIRPGYFACDTCASRFTHLRARQRLERRDYRQLAFEVEILVPPVAVPRLAFPSGCNEAETVICDEPVTHREEVVGTRLVVKLACALHELRYLDDPFAMHVGRDAGIPAIFLPSNNGTALGADDGYRKAQRLPRELVRQQKGQEAGSVILDRVARILV